MVADLTSHLGHVSSSEGWYYADAGRRVPGAALRRYLEIRDRSCTMIGCRAPARSRQGPHP
ncbi:MAG TPA: hypothetical protein VNA67_00750 [Pseudonocardiaceae bacterium]|nr:hypothetical protein [Pseudonocardiaceae bacterium]